MVADATSEGKLSGMKPIGIFDQSWVGVPVALAGLLYLVYVAARILRGMKLDVPTTPRTQKYLSEFQVIPGSNLDGKTIVDAELAPSAGRQLLSVRRDGDRFTYSQDVIFQGGDRLTFASSAEDLCGLWTTIGPAPLAVLR